MISIRSGVFVAVNRPPGCGSINAIWVSGLLGSGFGSLGLTEATSNVVIADAGAGAAEEDCAAGACADAVVAVSRAMRAKVHVERMFVISTFYVIDAFVFV